jgi:glutathione S-transferase
MDQLYQAEWCPHSRRVRQRFTELGVSFIARPVPADPAEREELRRKTGTDEIPVLLLEDGAAINGDEQIIGHLDDHYSERADAQRHRERAARHGSAGANGSTKSAHHQSGHGPAWTGVSLFTRISRPALVDGQGFSSTRSTRFSRWPGDVTLR